MPLIALMLLGCAPAQKDKTKTQKPLSKEEAIVGEYRILSENIGEQWIKANLLSEESWSFLKLREDKVAEVDEKQTARWNIKDGELQIQTPEGYVNCYRIEAAEKLIHVANIKNKKRTDYLTKDFKVFEKLTIRDLSVTGYWSVSSDHSWGFDLTKSGLALKSTWVREGKQLMLSHGASDNWRIEEGEVHVGLQEGNVDVLKINSDSEMSLVAKIENGERREISINGYKLIKMDTDSARKLFENKNPEK